ncbi:MAG: hypothetical protein NTX65_11475 [Ignavibacteriales bacterium]|nr:hypothetical protein [Ignavibacteriales bacterium]
MALNNLPEISDQILEAEKQIELRNFDAARLLLNELICANENNLDALNDLAVIEILTENYDLAMTLLMQILAIDTQNEVAIENLQYLREKFSPILGGPEGS